MSVQTENHDCGNKPQYVYINRHRIDGEWTKWCASFSSTAREGYATSLLYITHCPFCGKELEHG